MYPDYTDIYELHKVMNYTDIWITQNHQLCRTI